MPLQEFTALLVLATAMSFTPGPNTTLSTALAANHGLRRSLRFVLAVPVGWVLLLALCALGVGALVTGIPALRWAIKGVGIAYLLPESLIDPLTSVSGCGPAYAYLFIEALADGGVEMGLSRDMALKLAAQTLVGSGRMVLETGSHPGVLKDNVCSPGGATIAGVRTLEEKGLRGTVIDAVIAGVTRMKEVAENA